MLLVQRGSYGNTLAGNSSQLSCGPKSVPQMPLPMMAIDWVAVKEFKVSYYIGETLSFIIYTHHGNLI